jgi:hypothetical protein
MKGFQMNSSQIVKIYCDKSKGNVVPSPIFLKQGESFQFLSVNSNVTLFFPNLSIFDKGHEVIRLVPRDSVTVKITSQIDPAILERSRYFPYAVFCDNANDFAEGNSSPSMIIED